MERQEMRQKLKWAIAIVLMVVIVYCGETMAESSGMSGNITWSLNDNGVLTIRGSGNMPNFGANIPWGTEIKQAVIEKGITSIGDGAFYNCSSLTSITIPEGITSIGYRAFFKCSSLISIDIPKGVTSIGSYAFDCCTGLTNIAIPDSVTSIDNCAFNKCNSLTGITIPDSVVTFGTSNTFGGYSGKIYCGMESATAHYLGEYSQSFRLPGANYDLSYRYSNNIITGLEIIYVDKDAETLEIPEGVTRISNYALEYCSSLVSIIIPESVIGIANKAFKGCSSLTNINIPESVASIGDNAFEDCTALTNISIPEGITSIGSYTFHNCSSLPSIKIPESVTSIGDYAFTGCSNLTSITIPENVTGIGEWAFAYCSSLNGINIPEDITSISYNAFHNCSSLMSITFPDGVTSIGNGAFAGCTNLSRVYWPVQDEVNIGFQAFGSNPSNITLYCYEYSPLETVATNAGLSVSLINNLDLQHDLQITVPDIRDVEAGVSVHLPCRIFPKLPEITISYTSDNPDVGIVSNDGLFTAIAPGTANITVMANSATLTFSVKVVEPYVHATKLTLSDVWVVAKMTSQPTLAVLPADADLSLTWETGSTIYATVADDGMVTGNAVGQTTLTVTDSISGCTATATVNTCYPVTAVTFPEQDASVAVGGDKPLTAQVTMRSQSCENHLVSFTSSDAAIATVDENGMIHGISAGDVNVTATAINDSDITATIMVTVREPSILTLPTFLKTIESQAFAELHEVDLIIIPGSVTSISDDAFLKTDAVLSVVKGTYAESWADEHDMTYVTR